MDDPVQNYFLVANVIEI